MESEIIMNGVEFVSKTLEVFGVLVIAVAFVRAMIMRVLQIKEDRQEVWHQIRVDMGKALQFGLEFLVAADIIRTVTVKPTMQGIATLGLFIVVRTFLSMSITVENEGCWPWQTAKLRKE